MKAGPYLKQTGHATVQRYGSVRRMGDLGKNPKERAFPSPVSPDDADHFARLDVERHILQSPNQLGLRYPTRQMPTPAQGRCGGIDESFPERSVPSLPQADLILLSQVFPPDCRFGHTTQSLAR